MASKRTAKRAASSRPRRRVLARLSPAALWRTWLVIGWSVTIVLSVWALKHLAGYVRASGPDVACHLEWIDLPPWLSELAFADGQPVLETIAAKASLSADDDIQAPDLCARVAQGLQDSAWISEVDEVSAQRDGTVRVKASFRKPLAFVAVDGWAYLVDDAGVRLPPETSADFVSAGNWFLITGVSEPVPEVGQTWTGSDKPDAELAADLAAGLSLVQYLQAADAQQRLPFRALITAIDVANFDRAENAFDGRLQLRTVNPRCYIRWGDPPQEADTLEASASRKLDMLRTLYLDEGGQFPDGRILDVRGADRIRAPAFPGG